MCGAELTTTPSGASRATHTPLVIYRVRHAETLRFSVRPVHLASFGSVYSIRYFCPAQHGVAYDSYVHTVSTPHDTGNDRTRCALRSRAASVFVSATGHSGHSVRLRSTLHASMTNTFYTHMKDIWDALSTVNGTACARTCECCEDALSSLHCNGGCRGMISGRGFFWRTHRWDARRGATWATPGTTSMWSQAEKCLQLQVILLCVVIRDRKHRDSVRR